MAKISIVKPTGSDTLSLLSAFKTENLTYVIFDSEKVGSMGLPIIYISKLTEKLEKVTDDNEWQSVKNYLKGIINGTSFEYVKINDTLNADEVFYTPLTLPQSSFDLIKNRYIINEDNGTSDGKVLEPATDDSNSSDIPNVVDSTTIPKVEEAPAVVSAIPNISPVGPMNDVAEPVKEEVNEPINPVTPIMPEVSAASNATYVATPNVPTEPATEVVSTTEPSVDSAPVVEVTPEASVIPEPATVEQKEEEPIIKLDANIFMQDKETFLKACENMFDALVSKYQKQLDDLERREQSLKTKEQEVQNKLNDANEHLANAEAREQVANIAHDNAQKIMDISNLMPNNPNAN